MSGNISRSTLWTMTLVQVSCFPTAATSLSNFSISPLIVARYGASSSSVNRSIVVRVRFPRWFHWIPETVILDGAFLWRRILLIVSLICRRSASSLIASLSRWTTIVLSILFAGPGMVSFFFSLPFLESFAHVFVASDMGVGVLVEVFWLGTAGGWVWLLVLQFWTGCVFAHVAYSAWGFCLTGSLCS